MLHVYAITSRNKDVLYKTHFTCSPCALWSVDECNIENDQRHQNLCTFFVDTESHNYYHMNSFYFTSIRQITSHVWFIALEYPYVDVNVDVTHSLVGRHSPEKTTSFVYHNDTDVSI